MPRPPHSPNVIYQESNHEQLMEQNDLNNYNNETYFENEYDAENEGIENSGIYYHDTNEHESFENQCEDRHSFVNEHNMDTNAEDTYEEERDRSQDQSGYATMYEPQSAYQDQEQNSTTILNALEALAQNDNKIEVDVAQSEEENHKMSTAVSSAIACAREELLMLNENFSLLTRKNEDKKRREKLYHEKIVKKRKIVVNDISDKIQPEGKRLQHQLNRIKTKHIENRKTINLKFIEVNIKTDQNFQNNMKRIEDEIIQHDTRIQDVNELLIEIKNLGQENNKSQKVLENNEKQIQEEQNELLTLENDMKVINLEELEKESEDQFKELSGQYETEEQETAKLGDVIKSVNEEISQLNETIHERNKENKDFVEKQEITMKDKEEEINKLQDKNLKVNNLQLEQLTMYNIIEKESSELEKIISENEKTHNEINVIEDNINKDMVQRNNEEKQNEDNLNKVLCELNETLELINKDLSKLDAKINERSDTIIQNKLLELNEFKESEISVYDGKKYELKGNLEEVEQIEIETRHNLEITKSEIDIKETNIKDSISQKEIQIENLKIDFNNILSLIVYAEQEMTKDQEQFVTQLTNLNNKKDFLNKEESVNNNKCEQYKNEKLEELKKIVQNIEMTSHKIIEYETNVNTIQRDVQELSNKENDQKEKNNELEEILKNKEEDLNNIDITTENKELAQLENELSDLKIQEKDNYQNIKKEKETLTDNKNAIKDLNEKLQALEKEKTNVINVTREMNETISKEKTNYENEKSKLMQTSNEKQKHAQNSLELMKKSYANKLVFHSRDNENLKENCNELGSTREKIREDIKKCQETEEELQMKIEKKKGQVENFKSGVKRIKQIFEQNGFKDYDKYFSGFD